MYFLKKSTALPYKDKCAYLSYYLYAFFCINIPESDRFITASSSNSLPTRVKRP